MHILASDDVLERQSMRVPRHEHIVAREVRRVHHVGAQYAHVDSLVEGGL